MKVRFERDRIKNEVAWLAAYLGPMPASSAMQLRVDDDRATLTVTNPGRASARAEFPAQVAEPGVAVLPGRLMSAMLAKLPDEPVDIHAAAEAVHIECGPTRYRIPVVAPDIFPTVDLSAPAGSTVLAMETAALKRVTEQVGTSAASDEQRPALTAIRIEAADAELTAAATDSYRLAVRTTELPDTLAADVASNVPAALLASVVKKLDGAADRCTLTFGPTSVVVSAGHRTVQLALIDASFPEWNRLLPDVAGAVATVEFDREEATDTLKRVVVITSGSTNIPVSLSFDDGAIALSAASVEVGDASDVVPGVVRGDAPPIAFNAAFLVSALDAARTGRVCLHLFDTLKPAILTGVDDDEDFRVLLMPMRTS